MFLTKGVRAHSTALHGHDSSSTTRTHSSSAAPPCRGSNSAMGARASIAASFNHGTGACDSRTPLRHASCSKKAAVATRRPHTPTSSSPLLPDREDAVDLGCGKAKPYPPRESARLDPVFPRDRSGRSILFPIKEESTSLATSSPSSKMANGNEPPRAGKMIPPARARSWRRPQGLLALFCL